MYKDMHDMFIYSFSLANGLTLTKQQDTDNNPNTNNEARLQDLADWNTQNKVLPLQAEVTLIQWSLC